jgi:excisionase family DNA binding protein
MKKPVNNVSLQPLVVSVLDAAILLDVSKKTVWRMIAAREIETVTVGATRKIRIAEIERYLDENATPVKQAS